MIRSKNLCGIAFACLILTLSIHADAANLLTPNGNPTGTALAVGTSGTSALTPSPASYRVAGDCPWIIPALNGEGFNAANGWTINTVALANNDITLGTYTAYADVEPAVTQGPYVFPVDPNFVNGGTTSGNGYGGAQLGLGYTFKAGDPNPANTYVNWIQVVHTNSPSTFGTANGVNGGGGFTNYIDNGYGAPTVPNNPFYGGLNSGTGAYLANANNFLDDPYRAMSTNANWQAQVFLATWAPVNAADKTKGGTITLYDGVWWGFQVTSIPTPEPSTFVMAGLGFVGLIVVWGRRRGA